MFPTFNDFTSKKENIAIVGLGYVGLPLAVNFGHLYKVIGFDIDTQRIKELENNYDRSGEIRFEELKKINIKLTFDSKILQQVRLIIVTVPTPIDIYKRPDLTFIKEASKIVGRNLTKGTVIVYESTVYPGVTEEICVPILEKQSNLNCGKDFKVGYSPERVNPSDKKHFLSKIVKVVSGQDDETAKFLAAIYGSIIGAGIHIAPNIRTAEAAKVIENIQRDLNIALMNELAIIFNKLNIDTKEVLQAAATKWKFLKFEPEIVGGHSIALDACNLTNKAEDNRYNPDVII